MLPLSYGAGASTEQRPGKEFDDHSGGGVCVKVMTVIEEVQRIGMKNDFSEPTETDEELCLAGLIRESERHITVMHEEGKSLFQGLANQLVFAEPYSPEVLDARCEWLKSYLSAQNISLKLPQTAPSDVRREKVALERIIEGHKKQLAEDEERLLTLSAEDSAADDQSNVRGIPEESVFEEETADADKPKQIEARQRRGSFKFWRIVAKILFSGNGRVEPEAINLDDESSADRRAADDREARNRQRTNLKSRIESLTKTISVMEDLYDKWEFFLAGEARDRLANVLFAHRAETTDFDWTAEVPQNLYDHAARREIKITLAHLRELIFREGATKYHHFKLEEERGVLRKQRRRLRLDDASDDF